MALPFSDRTRTVSTLLRDGDVLEAARALAALPKRARARAARKIDLAHITTLGTDAVPLLRALVDDDDTRTVEIIRAWLAVDQAGCVTFALARLEEDWDAPIALQVLACIDPSEAYEVLAPRVEDDAGLRRFIVDAGDQAAGVFVDVRWIELALRLLARNGPAAVELLRLNGSPRADEELDGILERAVAIDDVVLATLEAIEVGTGLLDHEERRPRFLAALLRFLARPAAEGIEATRFSFSVSLAAHELRRQDHDDENVQRRLDACRRAHPLIVRG